MLLRFIHDIFHNEIKRRKWNEKLLKIIQKLNMPNGEEALRKSIYNILSGSKLTNEEKRFSIDHVIEVMKNLNVPLKNNLQVFQVTPYINSNSIPTNSLKSIAQSWITSLPLKDVYLDRKLDKNKIIHHSTKVLLQEINKIDKIPDIALKDNILNVLSDMPIDVNFHEKSTFLTKEVNKLIEMINKTYNIEKDNADTKKDKLVCLINKEVKDIFDKCHLCDETQSELLKLKVLNIIEETLEYVNIKKQYLKQTILDILRNDGKMNQREANNYTELIIYRINCVINEYNETPEWMEIILRACHSEPVFMNETNICLQKSLTALIKQWLESFQHEVPKLKEKEYLANAAKDLSNAIQARCRFLQNHPRRVNVKTETEFLKYLILIWINKMLGRNKIEVLKNTNILLKNILKCQSKVHIRKANSCIIDFKPLDDVYFKSNVSIVNFAKTIPYRQEIDSHSTNHYKACVTSSIDRNYKYEFMSVQFIFKHYKRIFENHCDEMLKDLPLNKNMMSKLNQIVVNIIWKVYYNLISDPRTDSNDFDILFERVFLESINEMKFNLKNDWTKTLSIHAKNLFECVYIEQRSCMFRITYLNIMNRDLGTKDQDLLLMNVFDNLVLYSKYENSDPFKAYIYNEQIKENLNNIARYVTEIDDKVFNVLDRIGLREEGINYEAHVILTRNQFKDWFKTLPLRCNANDLIQYKLMTVLAKNICVLSKIADKTSVQKEIEKEVIGFLQAEIDGLDPYTEFDANDRFGVNLPKVRNERVRFSDTLKITKSDVKSILKNTKTNCYCKKNKCKCSNCGDRKIRGVPNIGTVGVQVDLPATKETNTEHLIVPSCSKNICN